MEHTTQRTRRALPLEVVDQILQSFNDQTLAPTLFPLLTVSKSMFSAAVRRLYANPIKSLTSCRHPATALHRMLALIAQICPEVDQVLLQKYLLLTSQCLPSNTPTGSSPTHMAAPCDQSPFADYFSFVRVLDYRFGLELGIENAVAAAATAAGDAPTIHRLEPGELLAIVWMACRTQHLGKVREVSIHPAQFSKCGHMLEHMIGVEAIDCYFDGDRDVIKTQLGDITKTVSRLVEMRHWHAQHKPIQLQLHTRTGKRIWYDPPLYEPLRMLLVTLSSNTTVRITSIHVNHMSHDCDPNWARLFVMPESIDLANVRSICQFIPGFIHYGILPWPKGGKGAILQQCRGLRELKVYVAQENEQEEDPTLFAWAREERQQILSKAPKNHGCSQKGILTNTAGSSLNHPQDLVQLETLCLGAPWGVEMERSLQDALFAFGPTLQHILLHADWLEIDLAQFQYLPVLRELDIRASRIQYSTQSSEEGPTPESNEVFPRLESISLQEFGVDESPAETWESLVWPHMQRLSRIILAGAVAYRVTQATLAAHGSHLQELTMDFQHNLSEITYAWDLGCWQKLAKLQMLSLHGAMAMAFRSSMLETCPELSHLVLTADWDLVWAGDMAQLAHCFDNVHCQDGNNEGEEEDKEAERRRKMDRELTVDANRCTSKVAWLRLTGWAVSATDVEQTLPAMFPALERLDIVGCDPLAVSAERHEKILALFPNLKTLLW